MTFLHEVLVWMNDPLNWRGTDGIPNRLTEHLVIALLSLALAALVALPAGAWLGHRRRGGAVANNIANVGRAVPSIAVLVMGVIWLGGDYAPAVLTLTLLALPPIFTLTFTAVRGVDAAVVDAAAGMGLGSGYRLWRVELPVAWPLILSGLRLSTAAVFATATIAALPGGGGLGRFIVHGFAIQDYAEVFGGTLLVVLLVVLGEVAFELLGRFSVSAGLRTARRRSR
jgi:osmoprotectant transport system permease protein